MKNVLIVLGVLGLLMLQPVMAKVEVLNPYVKAQKQSFENSAAFMAIKNEGKKTIKLTSVQSDVAKSVELHTHEHDNGVMKMRKVDSIVLPAGSTIMLKPRGHHVMFIGLKRDLKAGEKIKLTFNFSNGTSKMIDVPVK